MLIDNVLIDGHNGPSSILISNGLISEIYLAESAKNVPPNEQVLDGNGNFLLPGLVDLQIYGAGGKLFHGEPSVETLEVMSKSLLKKGVTSFLPSMTSGSIGRYQRAFKSIREFQKTTPNNVLGVNIESPLINPDKAGFHAKEFIGENVDELMSLLEENSDILTYLTLAPEMINESWDRFKEMPHVKLSMGHSKSGIEIAEKLQTNNVRLFTHIFNGMSGFSGRDPGLIGFILGNEEVYTSFIPDGIHVSPEAFKVAFKILRNENRLFIISDGMPPIGDEMRTFDYEENIVRVEDGKCLNQNDVLTGTIVDVFAGMINIMDWTGIDLFEASSFTSKIPLNAINVSGIGKVEVGQVANLVLVDQNYNIESTILNGETLNLL